jgi:hypothetical protein
LRGQNAYGEIVMIEAVAATNGIYPRRPIPDLAAQSAEDDIVHRPERLGRALPVDWRRTLSPGGWTLGGWGDPF